MKSATKSAPKQSKQSKQFRFHLNIQDGDHWTHFQLADILGMTPRTILEWCKERTDGTHLRAKKNGALVVINGIELKRFWSLPEAKPTGTIGNGSQEN